MYVLDQRGCLSIASSAHALGVGVVNRGDTLSLDSVVDVYNKEKKRKEEFFFHTCPTY